MQIDQSKLNYIRTYMARDRASNEPCVSRSVHRDVDYLLGLIELLQENNRTLRCAAESLNGRLDTLERQFAKLDIECIDKESAIERLRSQLSVAQASEVHSSSRPSLTERVMAEIRSVPQGEAEG